MLRLPIEVRIGIARGLYTIINIRPWLLWLRCVVDLGLWQLMTFEQRITLSSVQQLPIESVLLPRSIRMLVTSSSAQEYEVRVQYLLLRMRMRCHWVQAILWED